MRRKNRAPGRAKSGPVRPIPWHTKEKRIVLLGARGLWNGRFESEGAAMRACRAALAGAGFEGRHTVEAIRDRIRTESRRLSKPPSRAYWTATEDRVIDRFARAVVRHEYRDATAAAGVCRKVLARRKHSYPRTDIAVAARIWARSLEYGRKQTLVRWTLEERRVLRKLAPEVSSGRFREVRHAARAFQARMARKRRASADGSKIPVRTLESTVQQLKREARETGLAWGFRDWSREEDRIVDSFIDRYSNNEFRSFRAEAPGTRTAIRPLLSGSPPAPEQTGSRARHTHAPVPHVARAGTAHRCPVLRTAYG